MPLIELDGSEFASLAKELLGNGHRIRFQARGSSMQPFISDGDFLEVAPLNRVVIQPGEVLLVDKGEGRLLAHRVIKVKSRGGKTSWLIKGDASPAPDGWYQSEQVFGRVEMVQRGEKGIKLTGGSYRIKARLWVMMTPWTPRFNWVPAQFRQRVRDWLLTA